jgi:hypothetical protein
LRGKERGRRGDPIPSLTLAWDAVRRRDRGEGQRPVVVCVTAALGTGG